MTTLSPQQIVERMNGLTKADVTAGRANFYLVKFYHQDFAGYDYLRLACASRAEAVKLARVYAKLANVKFTKIFAGVEEANDSRIYADKAYPTV
jgi:hypothetical protein